MLIPYILVIQGLAVLSDVRSHVVARKVLVLHYYLLVVIMKHVQFILLSKQRLIQRIRFATKMSLRKRL